METEYYHHIARQYFRGEASPAQEVELNDWLQVSEENRQLFALWQAEWHQQAITEPSRKASAAWAKMQTKIKPVEHRPLRSKRTSYLWYSAAAVALLLVGVALWLLRPASADTPIYVSSDSKQHTNVPVDPQDAVWGFYTEEKGEPISTLAGQKKTIALPDGSVVMMNGETTIAYDFGTDQRQVAFSGKAEFEVAKDAARPFIVRVGEYSVTVTGTHFTLFAKPGEWQYIISLQEGSVKVGYKTDTILMSPSETLRFYPKKEKFMYDVNGLLGNVLQQLEAIYNVRFILTDKSLADEPVYYVVEIGTTIDEIADALQTLLPITIHRKGSTYTISRK